jgi:Mn2+/Fe2+ NRAMP family transporter
MLSTVAIMVATAATLHGNGVNTITTPHQAARALRPLAGAAAQLLFAAGIVGTGALAIPVLAGSTGYAVAEAFGWSEGLSKRIRQAPGFYAVVSLAIVMAAFMTLLGVDPIRALFLAAVLNGLIAPPLIALMIVLSRAEAMGSRRSGSISYHPVPPRASVDDGNAPPYTSSSRDPRLFRTVWPDVEGQRALPGRGVASDD